MRTAGARGTESLRVELGFHVRPHEMLVVLAALELADLHGIQQANTRISVLSSASETRFIKRILHSLSETSIQYEICLQNLIPIGNIFDSIRFSILKEYTQSI